MKFETAIFPRGSGPRISSEASGSLVETLKLEREPHAWSRWLDWMPKVRLPPALPGGSPFNSAANTPLHQRVFLNGTATEVSLK